MKIPVMTEGTIFVRESCNTYIARCSGITASATSGAENAARRVAEKIVGDAPFDLERMGTNHAWYFSVRAPRGADHERT